MPGLPGTVTAPDLPPGPRLALVIATTTYADPGLRRLRAPARDATDLAGVLGDPAIGGFSVTSVVNQPAQSIRIAIEDFLADQGTQTLLLVYLSCHGLLDATRRLYFAAADTRKDRLGSTGVEAAWVLDQLEQCRARRQILILDSCFSGAFAHGAKGDADLGLQDRFAGQGRGRVVLTASNATEYSFEGEPTDPAATAGSVFTGALVAGLRTGAADLDHDGFVSVDDAYAYAFDQVKAAGAAQTPQRWLYGAEGHIVLARSPVGKAVTPSPLPESLRSGLESPLPGIRIGAVNVLGSWLASGDPAQTLAARNQLQQVAEHDNPQVAEAARALLDGSPEAGPSPAPGGPGDRSARPPVTAKPAAEALGPVPLPSRQVATLSLASLYEVSIVSFSPDGRLLAVVGGEYEKPDFTSVWDPAAGELLRTIADDSDVGVMAFSPDSQVLACCGDRAVRLWNPATGDHLRTLGGYSSVPKAAVFSPDGRTLTIYCYDSTLWRWDMATGHPQGHAKLTAPGRAAALLKRAVGKEVYFGQAAFSPDGERLATGHSDANVHLWNPATEQHLRTLQHDANRYNKHLKVVAFSPGGDRLVTANSVDMRLWNPRWGQSRLVRVDRRSQQSGSTSLIQAVAFTPDGRVLTTGHWDGSVHAWDPATGRYLGTIMSKSDRPYDVHVTCMAFSPDGRVLAVGMEDDDRQMEYADEETVAAPTAPASWVQLWRLPWSSGVKHGTVRAK
jgi:hypothetical protein